MVLRSFGHEIGREERKRIAGAEEAQRYFVKASMMLCGAMVGMILVTL